MQQLHVVGFTTDHRSLIFSTRRGSKTGTYVIAVDDELLAAVDEARDRLASGDGSAADEASARYPVPEPPRSALTVREVQSRLRLGYTVDRVAREAGVDPSWVERFASPVVAELTEVIRAAQRSRVVRPRGGPSATSLGESVLRNLAERGVPMAESDMGRAWQARQLLDGSWLVTLTYANRDREFEVSWEFDNSSGALRPRDRVASELGFVADPEWSDAPVESEAAHDESPQAPVPEERSESQRRVAEMRRAAQDRMVADAERASRRAAAMVRRTTPRPADVPPAPRAATAEAVAGLVAGEPIDPAPSDRDRPQAEGPRPAFEPRVGNGLDDDDDEDVASGAGSAPDDAQPTDGEDEEEQEWKAPVVDDGGTTGVAGRPTDGGDGPTDVAGALVPAPWSVGAEPETTPGPSEGHPADAAETLAPGHDAVEDLDEADGPTARETVDEGPPAASGSAGRLFAPEPAADEFERTMPFERIATDGPAPVQVSAIALGDNDGDEDEAGPAGAGGSIEDVGLDEREPVEPVEEVGRRDDPPAASPPEQSPPATPPLVPAAAPALPPVAPGPAGAKMPGPPWPRRRVPLQAVRLRPAAPAAAPAAVPPQLDGPGDDEPAPTPPAPDDRQGEPSGAPRGDAGQVPASAVGGSDDLDEDADPGPAVVPVWDEQDDGWGDDDEDEPVASGWADGPDRGWDDDDDDDWGAGRGGGSGEVGTVEPQAGAPEAGRPRRLPLRLRATEGRGSKPAGEAMVAGDRRGPRFRPDLARPADPTASADDGGATPARRRQLRAEPPGAGPAPPARRSEPLRARPRPSDE